MNKEIYEIDHLDLKNKKEVRCPECKKWIKIEEWCDVEPYCETCGYHFGVMCPECCAVYDFAYDEDEQIKESR